jgi:uncharacterized protein (TIGR00645 family)
VAAAGVTHPTQCLGCGWLLANASHAADQHLPPARTGITRMSFPFRIPYRYNVVMDIAPGSVSVRSVSLKPLPQLIFASRWLQVPLYLGLIVAQIVYVFLFLKELYQLVLHAMTFDEEHIMLIVLGLIDVVMISNLLVMVIVGGYETFVSRLGLHRHPDSPEWLSHVDSGVLKVKLAMSIIGISSISLLRAFVEARSLGMPGSNITAEGVMWQTIIHSIFILSAVGISFVDRLSAAPKPSRGHNGS